MQRKKRQRDDLEEASESHADVRPRARSREKRENSDQGGTGLDVQAAASSLFNLSNAKLANSQDTDSRGHSDFFSQQSGDTEEPAFDNAGSPRSTLGKRPRQARSPRGPGKPPQSKRRGRPARGGAAAAAAAATSAEAGDGGSGTDPGSPGAENRQLEVGASFSTSRLPASAPGSMLPDDLFDERYSRHVRPLVNALSSKLRRWAVFEWFYPVLDREYFAVNEFQQCLDARNLSHLTHLTRMEWSMVRATLGRPRRLSGMFLLQERRKLELCRQTMRRLQRPNSVVPPSFPFAVPAPLEVGDVVAALHPTSRIPCRGQILTSDSVQRRYRVQFDRLEMGAPLLDEQDIAFYGPPELIHPARAEFASFRDDEALYLPNEYAWPKEEQQQQQQQSSAADASAGAWAADARLRERGEEGAGAAAAAAEAAAAGEAAAGPARSFAPPALASATGFHPSSTAANMLVPVVTTVSPLGMYAPPLGTAFFDPRIPPIVPPVLPNISSASNSSIGGRRDDRGNERMSPSMTGLAGPASVPFLLPVMSRDDAQQPQPPQPGVRRWQELLGLPGSSASLSMGFSPAVSLLRETAPTSPTRGANPGSAAVTPEGERERKKQSQVQLLRSLVDLLSRKEALLRVLREMNQAIEASHKKLRAAGAAAASGRWDPSAAAAQASGLGGGGGFAGGSECNGGGSSSGSHVDLMTDFTFQQQYTWVVNSIEASDRALAVLLPALGDIQATTTKGASRKKAAKGAGFAPLTANCKKESASSWNSFGWPVSSSSSTSKSAAGGRVRKAASAASQAELRSVLVLVLGSYESAERLVKQGLRQMRADKKANGGVNAAADTDTTARNGDSSSRTNRGDLGALSLGFEQAVDGGSGSESSVLLSSVVEALMGLLSVVRACTDGELPPAEAAQALQLALDWTRPRCPDGSGLFAEIESSIELLKGELL